MTLNECVSSVKGHMVCLEFPCPMIMFQWPCRPFYQSLREPAGPCRTRLNVTIHDSLLGMPAAERAVLQEQLIDIILEVLKGNPQLHYYQGYHDVAVSLLLVVGERMAIAMLDTLSNFHLRSVYFFTSTKEVMFHLRLFVCQQEHNKIQNTELIFSKLGWRLGLGLE